MMEGERRLQDAGMGEVRGGFGVRRAGNGRSCV